MMKKTLLLMLLLTALVPRAGGKMLSSLQAPLLLEGRQWMYEGATTQGNIKSKGYLLKGDTLINERKYLKLYCRRFPDAYPDGPLTYHSAWREEGSRVYRIDAGQTNETLAFDFGLEIGDENPVWPGSILSTVDTLKVQRQGANFSYRRLTFTDKQGAKTGVYIEGLGGVNGLLSPGFEWGYNDPEGFVSYFYSCTQDGQEIIEIGDFKDKDIPDNADEDAYTPFVVEGKTWKGAEVNGMTWKSYETDYVLTGDTIIEGRTYKKCFNKMNRTGGTYRYECALREEDRRVYSVYEGQTAESLLFDFTLRPGDTFPLAEGGFDYSVEGDKGITLKLNSIDLVEGSDGRLLHYYNFSIADCGPLYTSYRNETFSWIEGVGKIGGYPLCWNIGFTSSYVYWLSGCYVDDALIYPLQEVNGIATHQEQTNANTGYFDLQGRRLTQQPQRGVYIQQGRKVIVR